MINPDILECEVEKLDAIDNRVRVWLKENKNECSGGRRMISTDYSKSEEMTKDIFKTVDNMVMRVKETQDEFIFSTLSKYAMDNFNIVVEKEELIQAIHLIRMCKEHGPGIYERWTTATQQTTYLDDAYRRGFQDGVNKYHDRITDMLEKLKEEKE